MLCINLFALVAPRTISRQRESREIGHSPSCTFHVMRFAVVAVLGIVARRLHWILRYGLIVFSIVVKAEFVRKKDNNNRR